MKRKLLTLVLGTALIMSTGITSLAAEPAETPGNLTPSIEATAESDGTTETMKALTVDTANQKEGLYVSHFPEFDENASDKEQSQTGYCGIISKEDMTKIISELGLSQEKSDELMSQYDKNMDLQNKINDLYSKISEKTSSEELENICKEVEKLNAEIVNIFIDDLLDKAIDLDLVEEVTISICPAKTFEDAGTAKDETGHTDAVSITVTATEAEKK